MNPEITIVVGTRNRPEAFERFAKSVFECASLKTQLIVTDASDELGYSTDCLCHFDNEQPRKRMVECDLIHEKPRLGTLKGYNVAFRKATGKYACWLNDDCELEPGWDKISIDYMDANPKIGIGAIYFLDRCDNQWQKMYSVQSFHGMHYANFGIVRKTVGDQIGWFDERIGNRMYGCDNSICLNCLVMTGMAVVPIPGCKVKHWRENDAARSQNWQESQDDGQKLGIFWHGDYSAAKQVYDEFKHLHQPQYIEP